ncbi:glyoxylate/hydroxypyruvate reductase A [Paracoccus sp. CPCC 101403]|uniref:Glyoxylate/hydroxypyruvate reductase A n=1 Tax=Paracoccus broussonetiae TaxID=3075834 RepID=A0ABU3E9L7_9RHOB|nr:glyoxylate/hydroxypyruvate reductase A [Paracoccus sp. CPCC 101403]MDT1060846.1 glyoxylate/hydroxypyruvate reductase A [Paracoccus sp. CPCC 101403]
MAVLFLSTAARAQVFREAFAHALPDVAFHVGEAPDPLRVRWIVTWNAPDDLATRYPNLRQIFSIGAGVDQFDLGLIPAHVGVVRMLEPGIGAQMGEYATLATLAMHRDLPRYLARQQVAEWAPGENLPAPRRRVGVMGLGQLGTLVIDRLRPFGFDLAGYSRSIRAIDGVSCFTDLAPFLARTDILICLLPLTMQTRGILDAALFAKLPRGARLVHLGRGAQLVAADLIAALDQGQLSAAMLDVTDPEPLPADHPLWRHPSVILTPHIASQTSAAEGAAHVIAGVSADLAGRPVAGLIDRRRGY